MPWIKEAAAKQAVVDRILNLLPDWFGIQDSITKYVQEATFLPCYVWEEKGQAVGFICLKETSECAAEIHVMGILPAFHRKGIGREFVAVAEGYCRERGLALLQVKTLAPSAGNAHYLRTYAFYRAMGFLPLEVLPLWDEKNPCLILVKNVK